MTLRKETNRWTTAHRSGGFSFLELMVSCAILLVILGPVIMVINKLQSQSRTEANKLDLVEESREFMDQIIRDLHQAGTPSWGQFDRITLEGDGTPSNPGCIGTPLYSVPQESTPGNCWKASMGLVRFTPTDLWFEADVDGDGTVNVVRYTLYGKNEQPVESGDTCPCSLKRSQGPKAVPPGGNLPDMTGAIKFDDESSQWGASNYSVELQNVANTDIFQGLQATGGTATGIPTANGFTDITTALNSVKTVRIKINVSPSTGENQYIQTVSLTADAKVGNN